MTVIDRRNYHLFQPLLYQVATGSLSAGEIASPLRGVLSPQTNARVWLGTIVDIDPDSKRVLLADGAAVPYDSLIVAAGSETSYWLTFVIVGTGPTGVELAGAIGEIARQTLKNDFRSIHPAEAQIILLDAAPRVLMSFSENLSEKAAGSLAKLGVQVGCRARVKHVNEEGLLFESEGQTESIAAKTVIWAGGIKASPLGKILASRTKAQIDKGGRVKVKPDLTVPNYPDIYVVGDLAFCTDAHDNPLPGLAQVAMQGGTYAAKAILQKVNGRPDPRPFRYFDKGSLAVMGRAAEVFGRQLSGLPAWLVWAFIHLTYLVTFQSRVLVFIQWAIQDLTFNRGSRLITGIVPTDFNLSKELSTFRSAPQREPEPLRTPH